MPDESLFCSKCGQNLNNKFTEGIFVKKPLKGLNDGIFQGGICVILGFILMWTGIGAIGGIIFIIIGCLLPIALFINGFSMLKGNCPYCGNELLVYSYDKSIKCQVCKKQVIIKNNKFISI
jgi:hypothetical protein